nr:immunoglobulin heavy chain junction region [Mus musculus]
CARSLGRGDYFDYW